MKKPLVSLTILLFLGILVHSASIKFLSTVSLDENVLGPYKVLIAGKYIYLIDSDKTVKMLDTKGNYIRNLGKKGEGPGEFKTPVDIKIYENKLLCLDAEGMKIGFFSLDGKFMYEKKIDVPNVFFFQPFKQSIFLVQINFFKGGKIIHRIDTKTFEETASFYDCAPVDNPFDPESIKEVYYNLGTLQCDNSFLYFIPILKNTIIKYNYWGQQVGTIKLPLPAIKKAEFRKGTTQLKSAMIATSQVSSKYLFCLAYPKKNDPVLLKVDLKTGKTEAKIKLPSTPGLEGPLSFGVKEDKVFLLYIDKQDNIVLKIGRFD